MRIRRASLSRFALPLVRPLGTAHQRINRRLGFLVEIEDESGTRGYGEATPLPEFGTESLEACERALRERLESAPAFFANAPPRATSVRPVEHPGLETSPCARSALESAALDLAARRAGHSLARELARYVPSSGQYRERRGRSFEGRATDGFVPPEGIGGLPTLPSRVAVQGLVGGVSPDEVAAAAREALRQGHRAFKLKLGVSSHARGYEADLERVAALRSVVGPEACLRLDANEAWNEEEARAALDAMAAFAVDFVEQPVPRGERAALRRLAKEGEITVAADEALLGAGVESCLRENAARVFVLKPAALGGPWAALDVALRARDQGIRVIWSTLIDGAVGRALPLALAATTGAEGEVHGLGTAGLLAEDLVAPDLQRDEVCEGFLRVHADSGLGFEPRLPASQSPADVERWVW